MSGQRKKKLLVITGPTAVGKTKLSIAAAKALDAEIISADSMQVYRGMDIGTDKIKHEKMGGIPHHMIDIMDPKESFSVFQFQKLAFSYIDEIDSRGRLPMIVGGTGFYIQSVLYGVDFSEESGAGEYRAELERRVSEGGETAVRELYEELKAADPDAAADIHENNVKRVIRALEYHRQTGGLISRHNKEMRQKDPVYDFIYIVLTDERQRLYDRINRRVDEMVEEGLEAEVRYLLDSGLTGDEASMQGLGYRQMTGYIRGEYSRDEAVELIKRDTRHFAKRQLTWFRRERDVTFVDRQIYRTDDEILDEIMKLARERFDEKDT